MNGENTQGVQFVQVEGRAFLSDGNDAEPRARDTDIAEWLGYARPRSIRDLIKRAVEAGHLSDTLTRRASRQVKNRQGMMVVEVDEYWLTESQALWIAAKSETPKANEVLKGLISFYRAANEQLKAKALLVPAISSDLIAEVLRAHAANPERFQSTAQVRDDIELRREMKQLIGYAAFMQGVTWRKIEGHIRSRYGVLSYLRLCVGVLDDVRKRCRELGAREIALPVKKGERGAAKMLKADTRQQKFIWN